MLRQRKRAKPTNHDEGHLGEVLQAKASKYTQCGLLLLCAVMCLIGVGVVLLLSIYFFFPIVGSTMKVKDIITDSFDEYKFSWNDSYVQVF